MMLTSALAAQAGPVSAHYRSNGTHVAPYHRSGYGCSGLSTGASRGYVYRNPYAAYPSEHVRGYYRSTGTYVWPHVRTAPNNTVADNLSYRGRGTARAPNYLPNW